MPWNRDDNRYLARLASESGKPLPKIFACCGRQDGCHDDEMEDLALFRSSESLRRYIL